MGRVITESADASNANLASRVVVVGNADVEIDYTGIVDGSAHVVRMNQCLNYGVNTGTRTTILGLINIGVTGRDHYKKRDLRDWVVMKLAEEIWFRERRFTKVDVLKTVVRHPRTRKQYLDYGEKLIEANGLQAKRVVYAPRDLVLRVRRRLWDVDRGRAWTSVLPTSGFLVIERVLGDPRFAGCEVCLVGFNWEAGTKKRTYRVGHTWDEEETLLRQYARDGRLTILPCDAK